jgi:hypothetical protein
MKIIPVTSTAQVQALPETRTIKMATQPERSDAVNQVLTTPAEGQVTESDAPTAEATIEPLSAQHLALARKEKALRRQQVELKAERDAWKAEQGKYIPKDQLKSNALKALEEAGITYDELVQQQLANPSTEIDPIQAKITALEEKLANMDSKQAERTSADYQQALKVIEGDVRLLVDSDPAFETIKARGQEKEVVNLIEQVFNAEGVILNVDEAAKLVEEKLLEVTLKEVEQLNKLKKIQARLAPPPAPAVETPSPKGPSKTLTNAMSSTRQLSSRERAILAFNGQLKN